MAYVIDGHNLIGVLPDIRLADPDDEQRLVERLRASRARLGARPLIVFFDAGPAMVPGLPRPPAPSGGEIEVRFARPGQTADEAILAYLRGVSQPGQYAVVSDDQELAWQARLLGANVIRASDFAARLAPRRRVGHPRAAADAADEIRPDPHAPSFADLYTGFIEAEKNRARFEMLPGATLEAWVERLYGEDISDAERAARWLGRYGGARALEPLRDALTHADARVRAAALLALGDLGSAEAVPWLCQCLASDAASMARQAAAQSLARVGDRRAEACLEAAAASDPKSKVRKAARAALAQVRARQGR